MEPTAEEVFTSLEKNHQEATHNPAINHDAISIIKQADGNWKGWMWKNGNGVQSDGVIEVRDIGPETVLQRLLTHD